MEKIGIQLVHLWFLLSCLKRAAYDCSTSFTSCLLRDLFVGAFVDLSVGPFVDLSVGPLVDLSVGPLVDLSVGPLVDFSVGPLVDLSVGAFVDEESRRRRPSAAFVKEQTMTRRRARNWKDFMFLIVYFVDSRCA